jgi:hypothetical protein
MTVFTRNFRPVFFVVGFGLVLLLASGVYSRTSQGAPGQATPVDPSDDQTPDDQARHGIRILHLRPIAQGHMIDLRFRVTDPVKAKPFLDRQNKSYLIDQQTGKALPVPITKAGPMRQSTMEPEAGRIYFSFFSNPLVFLKPGSKVTLAVGDIRIRDIVIEDPAKTLTGKAFQKEQQARMAQWKAIRQAIQKDYEAGAAQCGANDSECVDKYRDMRAEREQSEYMRVIYGMPSAYAPKQP